jgi:NTE family protein
MSAPGALVRAALRPWTARPGALAAAALPEGRISTDVVSAGLRPLFDAWPEAPLWINAVELDSGRRVTFTGGLGVEVDVATAVAASCAIPAFFAPVTIQGVRYVDGAAHSPTNADLVAGIGLDLVVISSPMSIAARTPRLATDEPFRRLARLVLAREANRIRRAGTPVLTFQPTGRDLTAMGSNNMDTSRRANVIHRVRDSTRRRLVRADALDRAAILARGRRVGVEEASGVGPAGIEPTTHGL